MAIKLNLLLERCNDISSWTKEGNDAIVDPAGQFKLYTNIAGEISWSTIKKYCSLAITGDFTIQLKTYFDSIGAGGENKTSYFYIATGNGYWQEYVHFGTDGLTLRNGSVESIVKCNASSAWQEWRFEFNMTEREVEVFLKESGGSWTSQGSFDTEDELSLGDSAYFLFTNRHRTVDTDGMCHLDYIYVGDGLGEIVANSGLFTFHG